jgi:hypothetical protein
VFFAHLIRACARLFIGSGKFVFYLCAANGDVIFRFVEIRAAHHEYNLDESALGAVIGAVDRKKHV